MIIIECFDIYFIKLSLFDNTVRLDKFFLSKEVSKTLSPNIFDNLLQFLFIKSFNLLNFLYQLINILHVSFK